jgi:hypothetical protein
MVDFETTACHGNNAILLIVRWPRIGPLFYCSLPPNNIWRPFRGLTNCKDMVSRVSQSVHTNWAIGESGFDSRRRAEMGVIFLSSAKSKPDVGFIQLPSHWVPTPFSLGIKQDGTWSRSLTSIYCWRLRNTGATPPQEGRVHGQYFSYTKTYVALKDGKWTKEDIRSNAVETHEW